MYEITIKEIKSVTKVERGEHTVIEERPYTQKELDDANAFYREHSAKEIKRIYGYAPDREVTSEVTSEIIKQRVESIDLVAVIKAINGI